MTRITFIAADGQEQAVDIAPGTTLMEGAVAGGVGGIDAECGGNCYCGTCRVHLAPEWLAVVGPQGEFEGPVIESTGDGDPGVRLSCQITVSPALDGLVARLPESQT